MGFDAASRYKLVDEAVMLPGRSLITRTEKGPFVDTGIELNKFDPLWAEVNQARIYLSVEEIRELAEGAGLFDEIRERTIPNEVAAYQRGFTEGVNSHGDVAALADRLDAAAARLRRSAGVSDPVVPVGEAGADPLVLVTDGGERGAAHAGDGGADGGDGAPGGQGDGAGGDDRPAVVPVGTSDGDNPFRI